MRHGKRTAGPHGWSFASEKNPRGRGLQINPSAYGPSRIWSAPMKALGSVMTKYLKRPSNQ
jgi:hypothetical protein